MSEDDPPPAGRGEDFIKRIAAQGDPEFIERIRQWQDARNQLEAAHAQLDAVFEEFGAVGVRMQRHLAEFDVDDALTREQIPERIAHLNVRVRRLLTRWEELLDEQERGGDD